MIVAQKQNKELQEKIVEMNKNAANAQKLHADQMVLSEKLEQGAAEQDYPS